MFDQFLKLFRGFTADNRRGYGSDSTGGIAISPKLARRERAVTAFLADLSHGLRTPLTGILVFSDLMKNESRGPLGDAKYAEYVTQIRDDSSHMLAIVDELPPCRGSMPAAIRLTIHRPA